MPYRHPIEIETRDTENVWASFAKCRADISGISGSEYFGAGAEQAVTFKNFRVPYDPGLAALIPQRCRIVYNGLKYDVKTIDDFEERHLSLVFRAEANYGR